MTLKDSKLVFSIGLKDENPCLVKKFFIVFLPYQINSQGP